MLLQKGLAMREDRLIQCAKQSRLQQAFSISIDCMRWTTKGVRGVRLDTRVFGKKSSQQSKQSMILSLPHLLLEIQMLQPL